MHRRRMAGCLLVLLSMAAALFLLNWRTLTFSSAQWGQPDLSINLYRAPGETDPFAPGNEITYQIYVVNWSMTTANDVLVTVTLPEHTTYVSSSGPGFTLAQAGPTQVIWFTDHLSDFERAWLSVTVRVNADAPVGAGVEAKAEIFCLDRESDYSNNESIVKEFVWPAEPDLQVTKHLWPNSAPIAAGNEIVYEIIAWNKGGTAASGVRLTDTLPVDCAYVSDDPGASGFATVQTGQTVVWTKDSMAPTEYGIGPVKLYVRCQVDGGWTPEHWLANVVEISTADAEHNYDNNLSRWVYKPEADRRYSAAITSLGDRTFRQASDAGFDYVLYYLDWSQAEPNDNEYYWGNLDHAVWQAWRYNLRLVVRVDRAPAWARGPGTFTAPPANPATLGQFLQAVAGRWPRQPGNADEPQIYGYVIWNEPDLADEWGGNPPDAAAYTALLQAAYNGVKAGSVNAWVISAGLAPTDDDPPNAVDDLTYLQAMYTAGAGGAFDYLGVNPMGFAYAPDDTSDPNGYNFSRAEAWRAIMEANGDGAKGMFGAETGWLRDTPLDLGSRYNWMKVSEINQAHYLARAYHKAQCEWVRSDGTPWMGPLTTWNLDFAAGNYSETDHPYWFGVTDENGEPLRSYLTLQNAATRGPADLWIDKELVDPLMPDQEFRYVIRYTNIGGQMASGVAMTDTLPAGAEYVSDTGGGTLNLAGDEVVWNLGDVYTCTYEAITLTLRLVVSDPNMAFLNNRVKVNTMPGEPYIDDNVATAINPLPDLLAIRKSVTPARVGPGQLLTYTLAFSNTGEITATRVVISDIVPIGQIANLSYARSGAAITPTGGVSYTWQVEDLSPGEFGRITITAVISPDLSGTFSLTNRATISTMSMDVYWPNNTSAVSNTVDGEPPVPPALASLANGAATSDNTPTLTWQPSLSADAAGYLLDFYGAVQDVGNVTQHITGVLADGTYTWTVAAYDSIGNTSIYTDVWTFSVDIDDPLPPALISPTNGITLADNTPTLTWNASLSADAAGYLLDVDGAVQNIGNVTQAITGTLGEGPHTWTVAAYDAAGNTSSYTDTWTFSVDTTPPLTPSLISPANGTLTNTTSLTLTWNASPGPGAAGYLLDFDGTVLDVGNTTWFATGILADSAYTWTVAAYDTVSNTSAYTDAWSFTVDTTAPMPPALESPANNTLTNTKNLMLAWRASPSSDVTGYLLDFDGLVQDVGNTTWFATGLLADGTCTWTVAAYDALVHTSAYTETWSFTVDTTPPALPTLISPVDGATFADTTPMLTWQASLSADAAGYLLDLNGTVQDMGNATQYTSAILADGTYTWTVAAYDTLGHTSAYTDTWAFTVDTVSPVIVAVSPIDGATEVAITAPVVVTFSRPIETSTFTFTASPDPGGWSVSWDDGATVATLTHNPFGYWRTYGVTVTAASDPLGNLLTGAPCAWSFSTGPYRLHLPLVTKGFVQAPDLVVERIFASSGDVQIIVRNQGNAPTRDGFWVDVYIDPDPIPTAVNQIWNHLANEGLAWGVTTDLQPMEALTLTVGGDYYVAEYSHVTWPLAAGIPVYAQADSANANTTYGAVLESHEIADGEYNNIGGPAYPGAVKVKETAEPLAPGNPWLDLLRNLPPRQ